MRVVADFCRALWLALRFCARSSAALNAVPRGPTEADVAACSTALEREALLDREACRAVAAGCGRLAVSPWWPVLNVLLALLFVANGLLGLAAPTTAMPATLDTSLLLVLGAALCSTIALKSNGALGRPPTLQTVVDYAQTQAAILTGMALFLGPFLLANLAVWWVCGVLARALCACLPTALALPTAALREPVAEHVYAWGTALAVGVWALAKTVMLGEVLCNHRFYRTVLQRRRGGTGTDRKEGTEGKEGPGPGGPPAVLSVGAGTHAVDAVFGYSYTLLGFAVGWTTLAMSRWACEAVGGSAPLALGLALLVRAPLRAAALSARAATYFVVHRLLHVRAFYWAAHREHHWSLSQTCLTASQESGLVEGAYETAFEHWFFVYVPVVDDAAFLWSSLFNSLHHHYYNEYRGLHWAIVKQMMLAQQRVKRRISALTPFRVLGSHVTTNVQFPPDDYKSPHLGLGSIDRSWHGQHHWTTNRHFGYGTFDCVSNLGCSGAPHDPAAGLPAFVRCYVATRFGDGPAAAGTTSNVNE